MSRGDIFVAFIFLGIIWLLGQSMWSACTSSRYRDVSSKAKSERKQTVVELPGHKDPLIVGDVPHQAQWPKARPFASRANVKGEG